VKGRVYKHRNPEILHHCGLHLPAEHVPFDAQLSKIEFFLEIDQTGDEAPFIALNKDHTAPEETVDSGHYEVKNLEPNNFFSPLLEALEAIADSAADQVANHQVVRPQAHLVSFKASIEVDSCSLHDVRKQQADAQG
jgi:hypothetical protein